MSDKTIDATFSELVGKFVPDYGKCNTLLGELLRAVNRMEYRLYNDGDVFYIGYGCETVGPCASFLYDKSVIISKSYDDKVLSLVIDEMYESDEYDENGLNISYVRGIEQLKSILITYYELNKDLTLIPNNEDMHDTESMWNDEDDSDLIDEDFDETENDY